VIDLYTWATPNGHKAQIMLEEVGLPYEVYPVDITSGAQFDPQYLKLNPNNKVPTVERGLKILLDNWVDVSKSERAKRHLFGDPQYAKRRAE
jgi:glutathione S-transferase